MSEVIKSMNEIVILITGTHKSIFPKKPQVIIHLLRQAALIIISNYSEPTPDKGGGGILREDASAAKTPSAAGK